MLITYSINFEEHLNLKILFLPISIVNAAYLHSQ
jgi:hypothetical protein